MPDRRLGLRSVVDRLYRGPCRTTDEFDAAAAPFRAKRGDMLALIDATHDLDQSLRGDMKGYIEAFFRAIDKPASIKKALVDACKQASTM
jgi:hypothetical protein